jgi:energy-coupling factor transporter ATP-binding protein EcfA2
MAAFAWQVDLVAGCVALRDDRSRRRPGEGRGGPQGEPLPDREGVGDRRASRRGRAALADRRRGRGRARHEERVGRAVAPRGLRPRGRAPDGRPARAGARGAAPVNDLGAALVERVVAGDERSLARLISRIEAGDPVGTAALRTLRPRSGNARVVGVTGAPGSGKSTLVDALIAVARQRDERVAVLAVDPSSPYSGGAILGDRIRMARWHADDGGVRALDGRPRSPRRARGRDPPGGDAARRDRLRPGARGDRRRGSVRGGGGGGRRHDPRGAHAGPRRRRAGREGGADGDRRRVRGQQGRPERSRAGRSRRPRCAGPGRAGGRARLVAAGR